MTIKKAGNKSKKPPIEAEIVDVPVKKKRRSKKVAKIIYPPALPADEQADVQTEIDRQTRIKKRNLTVREVLLIKGVVSGKKKRQAARDAGYTGSDATLSVTASKVLSKANVKDALADALEKHKVTVDSVVEVVSDAMRATKVEISGTGEQAFADVQPDHSIRLRAGAMAAKFLGLEDKEEKPQGGNTYVFNQQNNLTQYMRPGND